MGGHRIEAIGPALDLPQEADEIVDARQHLVVPVAACLSLHAPAWRTTRLARGLTNAAR